MNRLFAVLASLLLCGVAQAAVTFSADLISNLTDSIGSNATFTRTGDATCEGSDGNLFIAGTNVARHCYIDGVAVGVLMEQDEVNEAQYSEDMSNSVWAKVGTQVNATSTTDIFGDSSTTIEVQATTANGTIIQDLGTHASTHWVFSVYLKCVGTCGTVELTLDGGAGWTAATGLSTDWQRFQVTQTLADPDFGVRITTDTDIIAMEGAQLEENDYMTSYIPNLTTGTTTRNFDDLTYDNPTVSFPDANGSAYLEHRSYFSGDPFDFNRSLLNLSGAQGGFLYIQTSGALALYDGTNLTSLDYTLVADALVRTAISWATSGNQELSHQGSEDLTPSSYDGTYVRAGGAFAAGGSGASGFHVCNCYISYIRGWDEVFTDTELNDLTLNGLPTGAVSLYRRGRGR